MSRPVSVVGGIGLPQNQNNTPPLHAHRPPLADLLVANLRLLDLHLREDWPGITPRTLSAKDTQQNQKQRIKCTEWILYRLFELWDADETRDKLQPFFPPLEPLQSLNLRGALFRCLNELKKNGVLGRETVLRKTMLDECKGDKLMEVLVVFSTVVLRRADTHPSSSRKQQIRSVAYRLAIAPTLSAPQQSSLIPLTAAHAASLGNLLKQRETQRQRYKRFDDLLDSKRSELRERVKASVQSKRRESNVNEEAQVKKVVHDSWSGNTKWAQVLLTGDESSAGDLPLQKPFHAVWPIISDGDSLTGDAASLGLLASLESRVHVQKERLHMWQEFHDNLRGDNHEGQRASAAQRAASVTKFKFDRHQRLQLIPGRVSRESPLAESSGKDRYSAVLATLKENIAEASMPRRLGGAGWSLRQDGAPEIRDHDLFSPVKAVTGTAAATAETRAVTKLGSTQAQPKFTAPVEKPRATGYKIQRLGRPESASKTNGHTTMPTTAPETPRLSKITDEQPPARAVTPDMGVTTPIQITQASPEAEETAADRIIASAVTITPVPPKQHLTLTERTRMSMAFFNGPHKAPDSVDSGIEIPASASPDPNANDEDNIDNIAEARFNTVQRRVSLLERTRLSMAALPAHPAPRKSIVTRPKRTSLFPVNQFETPGRPSRGPPSPRRDVTPTEMLFSDEAEYASVFKSRPRVAMSPVFTSPIEAGSPATGPEAEEDVGMDSEDEDAGGEIQGLGIGFRTSPLASRRKMAA